MDGGVNIHVHISSWVREKKFCILDSSSNGERPEQEKVKRKWIENLGDVLDERRTRSEPNEEGQKKAMTHLQGFREKKFCILDSSSDGERPEQEKVKRKWIENLGDVLDERRKISEPNEEVQKKVMAHLHYNKKKLESEDEQIVVIKPVEEKENVYSERKRKSRLEGEDQKKIKMTSNEEQVNLKSGQNVTQALSERKSKSEPEDRQKMAVQLQAENDEGEQVKQKENEKLLTQGCDQAEKEKKSEPIAPNPKPKPPISRPKPSIPTSKPPAQIPNYLPSTFFPEPQPPNPNLNTLPKTSNHITQEEKEEQRTCGLKLASDIDEGQQVKQKENEKLLTQGCDQAEKEKKSEPIAPNPKPKLPISRPKPTILTSKPPAQIPKFLTSYPEPQSPNPNLNFLSKTSNHRTQEEKEEQRTCGQKLESDIDEKQSIGQEQEKETSARRDVTEENEEKNAFKPQIIIPKPQITYPKPENSKSKPLITNPKTLPLMQVSNSKSPYIINKTFQTTDSIKLPQIPNLKVQRSNPKPPNHILKPPHESLSASYEFRKSGEERKPFRREWTSDKIKKKDQEWKDTNKTDNRLMEILKARKQHVEAEPIKLNEKPSEAGECEQEKVKQEIVEKTNSPMKSKKEKKIDRLIQSGANGLPFHSSSEEGESDSLALSSDSSSSSFTSNQPLNEDDCVETNEEGSLSSMVSGAPPQHPECIISPAAENYDIRIRAPAPSMLLINSNSQGEVNSNPCMNQALDEDGCGGTCITSMSFISPAVQMQHPHSEISSSTAENNDIRHEPGFPTMRNINSNTQAAERISERPGSLNAISEDDHDFQLISEDVKKAFESLGYKISNLTILRNNDKPAYEIHLKVEEKAKIDLKTNIVAHVSKYLWYGSTKDVIYEILLRGFNRGIAGGKLERFGKGVYFAVDPSCCIRYGLIPAGGECHLIRAKVITGRSCLVQENQKLLPLGCHSAVDRVHSPSIHMIYDDWGAFPEFLLSFNLIK